MDERVKDELKLAFACDVYETIKAARKERDEKIFRHTMMDEGGRLAFAGVYPKQELLSFPDLTDEFLARLKTFNLLGVITDAESSLDMFLLGGMNKPLTSLNTPEEVVKILDDGPLMGFLDSYFEARGLEIDIHTMTYDAFLDAVRAEVFANTTFGEMSQVEELLKEMGQ